MNLSERNVSLLLLLNEKEHFLLQLRDWEAPTYPGIWGFFGGGIEQGETPEAAIKRESFEELRYHPRLDGCYLQKSYKDEKTLRYGIKHYFCEKYSAKNALTLCEGESMKWFDQSSLKNINTTASNKVVIKELLILMHNKAVELTSFADAHCRHSP